MGVQSHVIAQVSENVLTFLEKSPEEDLSAFCYLERSQTTVNPEPKREVQENDIGISSQRNDSGQS